jgi:hypothetical protein
MLAALCGGKTAMGTMEKSGVKGVQYFPLIACRLIPPATSPHLWQNKWRSGPPLRV